MTGSGPDSWRHDGTAYGIADLVGNVWEWVDLLKLSGGKIVMPRDNDFAADESAWLDTGAAMTSNKGGIQVSNKITKRDWVNAPFDSITTKKDQPLPVSVNQALLCPCDGSLGIPGHAWADNSEGFEALPLRGGRWSYTSGAGLAAVGLSVARFYVSTYVGFRPAFIG